MASSAEAPKIVQIETRYVETDAINFRDVVQSLTGKNSSTAWIGRSNNNNNNSNAHERGRTETITTAKSQPEQGTAAATTSYSKDDGVIEPNSMLTNNMSFKDFDRLLLELPSGNMESNFLPWL